ncbi:MAG: hypothetical protein A3G34_16030 [Candidatus Lindowbacteria bacterium RIFCSPLOWO2_12_FULL_62_27]|nr:MAG: hypothetical protein A3I06_12430 [Candidatus Lindowbacteria bacterium RIFCSPLOWO2_02_FULL_62_12]OGH61133.1 MAG: hypothetical protein A3G34_16030 [Candidatus Lindowbacteria bacterium RIFCSPLOWO2_12_FULL_62_27]
MSAAEFTGTFQTLEQKGLVQRHSDGKLSAAPTGLRHQNLSIPEYRLLYAILGLDMIDPNHPAIAAIPDILNSRPHLAGTRIAVEDISNLYEAGYGAEQILHVFPHLTRVDVDSALRFYFAQLTPSKKT